MSDFSSKEELIETDPIGFGLIESIVPFEEHTDVEVSERQEQLQEESVEDGNANFSLEATDPPSFIVRVPLEEQVQHTASFLVKVPAKENQQKLLTEDEASIPIMITVPPEEEPLSEVEEPIQTEVADWKLKPSVQIRVALNKLNMEIPKTEETEHSGRKSKTVKTFIRVTKTEKPEATTSTSFDNSSQAKTDSSSSFKQIIDDLYKLFVWCEREPNCTICNKYIVQLRNVYTRASQDHIKPTRVPKSISRLSRPKSAANSSSSRPTSQSKSQGQGHNFSLRTRKRLNYNYKAHSEDSDAEFISPDIDTEFKPDSEEIKDNPDSELPLPVSIVKVESTAGLENEVGEVFQHCTVEYGEVDHHSDPDFDPDTNFASVLESTGVGEIPNVPTTENPPKPKKKRSRRSEQNRNTTCNICKQKYTHYKGLIRHLRRCHVNIPKKTCKVCNTKFDTKILVFRHVQQAHQDDNIYICPICNKDFAYYTERKEHMREAHPGLKPLNCDVCGMRFEFKHLLDQHFRSHTGEKPYECEYCQKRFTTKFILNIHTRRHTGETPYSCLQCDDAFVSEAKLTSHMRNHTGEGKPHKCDQCPKSYDTISLLRIHVRSHTGEKPFMCEECSKCFASKSNLKNHLLTHNEREIICEVCTKLFRTKSKLREHLRVHTGERPHMCEQCGKCYKAAYQLTLHTRVVHLGMQRPKRKRKSQAKVRRPVEECPPVQGGHYSSDQQASFDYGLGQYILGPNI